MLREVQSHEHRLEYLEAENKALRQEVRALRGG
jgi:cell division protein FtsB